MMARQRRLWCKPLEIQGPRTVGGGKTGFFTSLQRESNLYSDSMKTRIATILAMIALPLLAYGQSTLSFPRVMQPQDFSTTGFALVNPGATSAPVTFTLYGDDGHARGISTQT